MSMPQESVTMSENWHSPFKVTNDVAERNVKMVTDFSGKITADKEQRQCLLQMVEKHRKAYPSFKKKILNA